jgi:hypothetical protein
MPLIEIKNEDAPTASVKCQCGVTSDVLISTLVLGASATSPDVIALPACACGMQEFLFRTFDGEDSARAGHRKAVNALAQYLKGAGRVHPDALSTVTADRRRATLTRSLFGPVV